MDDETLSEFLDRQPFLTFAGTETYLLFLQRFPLREFCAFEVTGDEAAFARMEDELLRPIADAALANGFGLLTDTFVWRASADHVARLGHQALGVEGVNARAVERTRAFVERWRSRGDHERHTPVLISGDVGPRGDGYALAGPVSVDAAYDYHAPQVLALAEAGVDLIAPLTMTSIPETLGIVRAAQREGLAVLVSPTVETDGRIPDGSSLGGYIESIDAATSCYPSGYLVNCAHPRHMTPTLTGAADAHAPWLPRLRGLRTNASPKSHAELDNATALDRGTPDELAAELATLARAHNFTIVGGCCGTDAEHLQKIARACAR